jgi:hypothetical protein
MFVSTSSQFDKACTGIKIKLYRTIILSVVWYGCATWSVTLREEHRLRVFENRILRKIFGPKRNEVARKWRRVNKKDHMICTPRQILCV